MLIVQEGTAFVVWLGAGWFFARWLGGPGGRLRQASKKILPLLGVGGLLGGLALLVVGLGLASKLGGVKGGMLTLPAWGVVVLVGAGFVSCQIFGAVALLTLSLRTETKETR